MSAAATLDFDIDDASVWSIELVLDDDDGSPVDFTGYHAALTVYPDGDDSHPLITVSLFHTTPGANDGKISWTVAPSTLAVLTGIRYRYAVQLFPAASATNASTLMRGWLNMQHSPAPVVPA